MKNKNLLFIIGAILIFVSIVSILVFLINTFYSNREIGRYTPEPLPSSPFIDPVVDFYIYWPVAQEFEELINLDQDGVMSFLIPHGTPILSALDGEVSSLLFGSNIFPGLPPQVWDNNPPIWLVTIMSDKGYEIRYILTGDVMVQVGQRLKAGELIARAGDGSIKYLFKGDPSFTMSVIKDNQLIILNREIIRRI